jgi:tRNA-splicing endonuclease subunit Sen2
VVIIPVFEDPEEQKLSPYRDEDWYGERMGWKWMNTIMRVNSLVQKVSSDIFNDCNVTPV